MRIDTIADDNDRLLSARQSFYVAMSTRITPMLWRFGLVLVLAFVSLLTLTACGSSADAKKVDESLMALLSRIPPRDRLPDSARFSVGKNTALFSRTSEIDALNIVLGSIFVSGSDPAVMRYGSDRVTVGELRITVRGITRDYKLMRSATNETLWCIRSSGLLFFRDDGKLQKLLRAHDIGSAVTH